MWRPAKVCLHLYAEWNPDRDNSLCNLCRRAIRKAAKESPEARLVLAKATDPYSSSLPPPIRTYLAQDEDPTQNERWVLVTPGNVPCKKVVERVKFDFLDSQHFSEYTRPEIPSFLPEGSPAMNGILADHFGALPTPTVLPIAPYRGIPANCCSAIGDLWESFLNCAGSSFVYANEILEWKPLTRFLRKEVYQRSPSTDPKDEEEAYGVLVQTVQAILAQTNEFDPRRIRLVFWFRGYSKADVENQRAFAAEIAAKAPPSV